MKANPHMNSDEAEMVLEDAGLGGATEKGAGSKGIELPEELPSCPFAKLSFTPGCSCR